MKKHGSDAQTDASTSRHANRHRLQTLLFNRATFGTAQVNPGGAWDPKLPPFVGE